MTQDAPPLYWKSLFGTPQRFTQPTCRSLKTVGYLSLLSVKWV